VKFPWDKIDRGQGFFIPCLDPKPVIEKGLQAALRHRILNAKHVVGIKDGLTGVFFYRPAR